MIKPKILSDEEINQVNRVAESRPLTDVEYLVAWNTAQAQNDYTIKQIVDCLTEAEDNARVGVKLCALETVIQSLQELGEG